jgi:HEAT repeat protein
MRSSWLGFTPKEKVEIAPLTKSQQRKFSSQFFVERQDLRSTMRGVLDGNPALSHAFTTPLLLTFGCLLHGEPERVINESTTYVQIYGLVISGIFAGSWREDSKKPYWAVDQIMKERHLNLLDKICWEIFQKKPEVNLFTLTDWTTAYEKAKTNPAESAVDPDKFLTALEKLGFVVEAESNKHAHTQWSFAHRTFLEFLAARALAKREDDWLRIARQHFWFAPEWLECLTFLAGLLEVNNVKRLINAVRNQKDDIFGSMIFLEARFTGVSNLSGEVTETICNKIINGLSEKKRDYRSVSNLFAGYLNLAHSYLNLNRSCRVYIFDKFFRPIIKNAEELSRVVYDQPELVNTLIDSLVKAKNDSVRRYAAKGLGNLGNSSPEVIEALISAVEETREFHGSSEFIKRRDLDNVRESAAEALGKLGNASEEVIAVLIKCLLNDKDHGYGVLQTAAKALGNLGNDSSKVIAALIYSLKSDADFRVRHYAALALCKLGNRSTELISALINSVLEPKQYENCFRESAAQELCELGHDSSEVAASLIGLLRSNNVGSERYHAAEALGSLGRDSAEVRAVLINSIRNDSDKWVCKGAARALGNLGNDSEEVLDVLIRCLLNEEDYHYEVRQSTAEALGNLGNDSPKVIAALIYSQQTSWFRGTRGWVRDYAAVALGKLGIKNKDKMEYSTALQIMKVIANRVNGTISINRGELKQESRFTIPLFEIWQAFHTEENKPILTWKMLRKVPRLRHPLKARHFWH